MILHRPAADRGATDIGWLDSRHTFSFGDYYDPQWMAFRNLRVINDDRIAVGGGFPTHPHRDMEIISWIVEGALAHRDSEGNSEVIRPGDAQRMTAGTGIRHSEFTTGEPVPTRLLQIWIMPNRRNLRPGYEQKSFAPSELAGHLRCVAAAPELAATAGAKATGSITLNADAALWVARLAPGDSDTLTVPPGRHIWIQVATGSIEAAGKILVEGDGLGLSEITSATITAKAASEVLVFDLG